MHDVPRARADEQHTAWTRRAALCIEHDCARHRRLEDDAPGDAELGAEVVGTGVKDNVTDGGVGECTGETGAVAYLGLGLQLTAVAGHREL